MKDASRLLTVVLVVVLELVFQDLNLLHHVRDGQGPIRGTPFEAGWCHSWAQHQAGAAVVGH